MALTLGGAALLALAACPARTIPAAAPPLRPPPEAAPVRDCLPTDPQLLPDSVPLAQRRQAESRDLARQGIRRFRAARRAAPAGDRGPLLAEAVTTFLAALRADPYHVEATYYLAAAYATAGRGQCAVNLLQRLAQMRPLESKRYYVEAVLDRFLGRGRYRGKMDPAFAELRGKDVFRAVIRQFKGSH